MTVANGGMTLYTDNDTQETWSGSDDLDGQVFIQGADSESWLVGKNANETSTITLSASMGTPKYFTFYMKSDWGSFYTEINVSLLDGTSTNLFIAATGGKHGTPNLTPEISGDFKPSVLQMDQGTVPAYVPNNHTGVTFNVDASSSGNIRSITNHWIDCMYYGTGRTITGTTAGDKLFEESDSLNVTGDTFDGCSESTKAGLAYNTDVLVNTTTGNSFGETVTFAFNKNTDNIYTLEVTGTAAFSASSYRAGTTAVTLNLLTSAATSWSMAGGAISGAGTTIFKAAQSVTGAVFTDRTSITHNGATFEDNTVVTSGIMTAFATGTLTGNTFNKATGTTAVTTANTSYCPSNTFVSDGSGHAIELTGAAATYVWTSNLTSYDVGVASGEGVDVAVTGGSITGNEALHITAASGTFRISVTAGDTPSVSSAGAVVYVIAGEKTFTQTISPVPTPDYEYRLYTVTAEGDMAGAVEITAEGEENATTGSHAYTHTETNQPIAVQIISNDYVERTYYDTLTAADKSATINLDVDTND
jgi:hypothetical protein